MPAPDVVAQLATRFSAVPSALGVELAASELLTALRALRDVHGYRYYVFATGSERSDAFEVAHAVRNLDTADTIFVRVAVPKEAPAVDSIAFLYAGAEWQEREIFDLFGIVFSGHPDLRRILMPDEYPGHPLRKDFAMDTPWGYRPPTAAAADGGEA